MLARWGKLSHLDNKPNQQFNVGMAKIHLANSTSVDAGRVLVFHSRGQVSSALILVDDEGAFNQIDNRPTMVAGAENRGNGTEPVPYTIPEGLPIQIILPEGKSKKEF